MDFTQITSNQQLRSITLRGYLKENTLPRGQLKPSGALASLVKEHARVGKPTTFSIWKKTETREATVESKHIYRLEWSSNGQPFLFHSVTERISTPIKHPETSDTEEYFTSDDEEEVELSSKVKESKVALFTGDLNDLVPTYFTASGRTTRAKFEENLKRDGAFERFQQHASGKNWYTRKNHTLILASTSPNKTRWLLTFTPTHVQKIQMHEKISSKIRMFS